MKKTNLFITAIVIAAVSVVTGCKKDYDDATPTTTTTTETNTQKLTGKTFVMSSWTSSPAWYGVTDIFAVTEACYLDNTIMYSADGTFTLDKGNLMACDSSTATSGTWAFNADETELIVNGSTTYTLVTNDGSTLYYTTTFVDTAASPNTTHEWTITFVAQTVTPASNTENLAGTYAMVAWLSDPAWYGMTDIFTPTEACYKDNMITYAEDGTFTIDLGTLVDCDTATATSGTWAFNADETEMTINGDAVYTIITNDGSTLSYSTPFTDTSATPNTSHIWTFTFQK